jgi:hypothetical protein
VPTSDDNVNVDLFRRHHRQYGHSKSDTKTNEDGGVRLFLHEVLEDWIYLCNSRWLRRPATGRSGHLLLLSDRAQFNVKINKCHQQRKLWKASSTLSTTSTMATTTTTTTVLSSDAERKQTSITPRSGVPATLTVTAESIAMEGATGATLSLIWPSYIEPADGGIDDTNVYEYATTYITERFSELYKVRTSDDEEGLVYTHICDVFDNDNIAAVFNAIKDTYNFGFHLAGLI